MYTFQNTLCYNNLYICINKKLIKYLKIFSIALFIIGGFLLSQKQEYRFDNPISKPTGDAIGYDYQNGKYIYKDFPNPTPKPINIEIPKSSKSRKKKKAAKWKAVKKQKMDKWHYSPIR